MFQFGMTLMVLGGVTFFVIVIISSFRLGRRLNRILNAADPQEKAKHAGS